MSESQSELDKLNSTFIQFIIAVNGALIAYAIKQIENVQLEYKLIPLGLAIISWAISFYFGITSFRKFLSGRIIGIIRKSISIPEEHKIVTQSRDKLIKLSNDYNNKMYLFLYGGGVCYIIWQLIEMILRTK